MGITQKQAEELTDTLMKTLDQKALIGGPRAWIDGKETLVELRINESLLQFIEEVCEIGKGRISQARLESNYILGLILDGLLTRAIEMITSQKEENS